MRNRLVQKFIPVIYGKIIVEILSTDILQIYYHCYYFITLAPAPPPPPPSTEKSRPDPPVADDRSNLLSAIRGLNKGLYTTLRFLSRIYHSQLITRAHSSHFHI